MERQQAEVELKEIGDLGLKFVRGFLEGKAEIYIRKFDDGSFAIRLKMDK